MTWLSSGDFTPGICALPLQNCVHRNRNFCGTNLHRRAEIAAMSSTLLTKETLQFRGPNIHRWQLAIWFCKFQAKAVFCLRKFLALVRENRYDWDLRIWCAQLQNLTWCNATTRRIVIAAPRLHIVTHTHTSTCSTHRGEGPLQGAQHRSSGHIEATFAIASNTTSEQPAGMGWQLQRHEQCMKIGDS